MWRLPLLAVLGVLPMLAAWACWPFDGDRLDRTRRGSLPHLLPLLRVGSWIVPKCFLTMQHEHAGRQETALGIGLAPVEVDH